MSIDRLLGEQAIISQIKNIISCNNCQKQQLNNAYYDKPCHKGTYCQSCIAFCANCSRIQGTDIPLLAELIAKVGVKCENSAQGRKAILTVADLGKHESTCSYKPDAQMVKTNHLPIHANSFKEIQTTLNDLGVNGSQPQKFEESKGQPTQESILLIRINSIRKETWGTWIFEIFKRG